MSRARPLATAVLAAAVTALVASPASADAGVSITSDLGSAVVSLDGPTTISVNGTGFQSIQGGFGGIYVFFGWVDDPGGGSWRPSQGGQTGVDYLYVPDSEAKDNAGYQRFVTFPGSGTAAAANGGEVAADGSWDLTMVVPGPTFQAVDRDGGTRTVDCREVTCGVITIGAHGVANANNETFTSVDFVSSASGGAAGGSAGGTDGQSSAATGASAEQGGSGEQGGGDDAAQASAPPSGPATIGLEQSTIIAGRVLAFTGVGFQPGEQVVAVLGAGETGAGPLIAGQLGEVAGAVTLPPDLRPGTHVLTLAGAGSGQVAEATISVMADPAVLSAAEDAAGGGELTWPVIAVLVTAAVLALLILSSLVTAITRRRHRRAAAAAAPQAGTAETSSSEIGAGTAGSAGTAGTAGSTADVADTAVLPAVPERRSARERVDA